MELKHVALDYFPEFKCLADKCNYSCCTGWKVGLTRQEYMKTKNLRSTKQLSEIIKGSMKRNKDESSAFYAFMQLKENGDCPFLNENKLCALQLEHGPNVLSGTCKTFPRMKNSSPVQWEEFCTIGCEQVVNLLLQRPQGVRLVQVNDEKTATIDDEVALWRQLEKNPRLYFYKEIQMLFMGILQNRRYSLDHRMILLGLAARNLDKATTKEETIAFLKKSLPLLQYSAKMETQLNNMQTNLIEGLKMALPLTLDCLQNQTYQFEQEQHYLQALKSIKNNIQVEFADENSARNGTFELQNYLDARQHFASLEYTGYLLENVMVNTLFERQFPLPWSKQDFSVWEEYLYLFADYNALKVLSTAYMADKNQSCDLVDIITICGRMMLHNKGFYASLVEQLHKENKDTLAHIAMMLCC